MKWFDCKNKSFTPPINQDLLLANEAAHFPSVDLAKWNGKEWIDPHDNEYFYRDHEVHFWTYWPEYPKPNPSN